ncbi:MAG: ATP-binding cassette domain-containing protein [Pseudomonadota bacterium]
MAGEPPLLALRDARLGFGERPLFIDLAMSLSRGDKTCLVGRNGAGKSSLMKVLAGQIELDSGERFLQPGIRPAYLPQEPDLSGYETVGAYVKDGLPADQRDEAFKVDSAVEQLNLLGDHPAATLSGGEAKRAALARLLVADPGIILLDEPTNHLDLTTIGWLEDFLLGFNGSLLMISHDRALLKAVSTSVLWLDRGLIRRRERGFDGFEDWAEKVVEQEAEAAHKLNRKIAAETKWSVEGITARRKRNQGRLRALAAMRQERRDRPAPGAQAKLSVADADRSGKRVLEARGLSKSFGEQQLFSDFSTRLLRGDRVGVIGPNGAGKTTLVKILIGQEEPDEGSVALGSNIQIAWFDQRRESLDPEASVQDNLLPGGGDMIFVGDRQRHIASYLGDFLFEPGQFRSPVKSLSGGERNRLLLARLFARPSNLLVLDEPTNDLDIETLDLLEDVLGDYGGTLILISHDRDFLDRLVTSTIALEGDGRIAEYVGGYSDYVRQQPSPSRSALRQRSKPKPKSKPKPASTSGKLSYKDQRVLSSLPEQIDALEAEISEIEQSLADPDLYRRDPEQHGKLGDRLTTALAEKEQAEDQWLELAARAEALST